MSFYRAIGALLLLGLPASAEATVLRVPVEYATVNAALDVATSGDTVLVAPGTYTDAETRVIDLGGAFPFAVTAMAFLVDGVTLRSEAGAEQTVLDMSQVPITGAAYLVPGAFFSSPETTIEGFTLIGPTSQARAMHLVDCGHVVVRSCVVVGFNSGGSGGGILGTRTDLEVEDSEFRDCVGTLGGAIHISDASLAVSGTVFQGCQSSAVYIRGEAGPASYTATIADCTFIENASAYGGGAFASDGGAYGLVAIERCTFVDNQAVDAGGGVALGGVAWLTSVRDNVFIRCRSTGPAARGGGAYVAACPVDIAGNTFYDCSVSSGRNAAALYAGGCFVQTEFGNNVFANSAGGSAVRVVATTTVPSSCNVFWNNADGDYEGLELSSTDRVIDPLFCDPSTDDLRLAGDSPCLPANSAGCGLIGALGYGCGPVSLESRSWGSIKAIYR